MLTRLHHVLFQTFLVSWVLFWSFHVLVKVTRTCRFSPHTDLLSYWSLAFCAFVAIGSALLSRKYWKYTKSEANPICSVLYPNSKLMRWTSLLANHFVLTCTGVVFGFFTCFFWSIILEEAALTSAFSAELIGQFELSERLYRLGPRIDGYSTFGVWHTTFLREPESVAHARSQAVKHVFGANSIEMADRYYYVGLSKFHAEEDAYPDLQQSEKLYELNGCKSRQIAAIGQMALQKFERNDHEAVRTLVGRAADIVVDKTGQSGAPMDPGYLPWYAYKLGDLKLAAKLEVQRNTIYPARATFVYSPKPETPTRVQPNAKSDHSKLYLYLALLAGSVAISSGGLVRLIQDVMLSLQRARAKRELLITKVTTKTAMGHLDTMIRIDLFRTDFDNADRLSRAQLELAQGTPTGKIVFDVARTPTRITARRLVRLVIDPMHALLFSAFFLSFLVPY